MVLFRKRPIGPCATLINTSIYQKHNTRNLPIKKRGKYWLSSKGKQYLMFKDNLNFEKYLINVSKFYYSKIIKYRTGNHRLPVETGRWDDIPLNERKCKICTKDDFGDEYHYLFTCDFFKSDRKLYLKPYFYV